GIRLSLASQPDLEVVAEAHDGNMLIELVERHLPDVVITDIRMPICDGITATRQIKEQFPQIKVVAFSMFDQEQAVQQMREAGASGYIMKNSSLAVLLDAVRTVAQGKAYFDEGLTVKNADGKDEALLSSREAEILRMIGQGKTSQEIADILFIGKSTVDTHRKNILRKMNAQGKTDLLRIALERKYDFE
ncbi:MAG TPA: response regulator transcription factor, partial [Flavobacterium sp.]|nr:response regulator transcription factor [Flavobacterium sp.]